MKKTPYQDKLPGRGGSFKIYPRAHDFERGWFTQIPNEVINGIGIYGGMHACEYRLYTTLLSLRADHIYRTRTEMLRMVGADWNTAREQLPRLIQLGLVKVHADGWEVVLHDDFLNAEIPDRIPSRKTKARPTNNSQNNRKEGLESKEPMSSETIKLSEGPQTLHKRAPDMITEHSPYLAVNKREDDDSEDLF